MALQLRRQTIDLHDACERDSWECGFIVPEAAIQVCVERTPSNRGRELRGVVEAIRLPGKRRAITITLDQTDHVRED